MPSFSVVIPTFNRLKLLRETLSSVLAQEEETPEIIVVDDGSTDGTLDYLRTEHPGILTIAQRNAGPGAARNRGIERAGGDFVAFLDSDDLWFPWTTRIYREALRASGADLLFGKPERFQAGSSPVALHAVEPTPEWLGFDDYFASGDEWRWWGASSFVVRRERLGGVRFVEESINGEDADWVMKLGHGIRLTQIIGHPTFGYREHPGSVMKQSEKTLAGAWNLVRSEKRGLYPGGAARRAERLRILGRHLRPVILDTLRNGPRGEGRRLLGATLPWHFAERRFHFLAAALAYSLKP